MRSHPCPAAQAYHNPRAIELPFAQIFFTRQILSGAQGDDRGRERPDTVLERRLERRGLDVVHASDSGLHLPRGRRGRWPQQHTVKEQPLDGEPSALPAGPTQPLASRLCSSAPACPPLSPSPRSQSQTSVVAARLLSAGLIVSWLKLLKYARAFPTFGPFAVMLGNMMGDILKFIFLYVGTRPPDGMRTATAVKAVPNDAWPLTRARASALLPA